MAETTDFEKEEKEFMLVLSGLYFEFETNKKKLETTTTKGGNNNNAPAEESAPADDAPAQERASASEYAPAEESAPADDALAQERASAPEYAPADGAPAQERASASEYAPTDGVLVEADGVPRADDGALQNNANDKVDPQKTLKALINLFDIDYGFENMQVGGNKFFDFLADIGNRLTYKEKLYSYFVNHENKTKFIELVDKKNIITEFFDFLFSNKNEKKYDNINDLFKKLIDDNFRKNISLDTNNIIDNEAKLNVITDKITIIKNNPNLENFQHFKKIIETLIPSNYNEQLKNEFKKCNKTSKLENFIELIKGQPKKNQEYCNEIIELYKKLINTYRKNRIEIYNLFKDKTITKETVINFIEEINNDKIIQEKINSIYNKVLIDITGIYSLFTSFLTKILDEEKIEVSKDSQKIATEIQESKGGKKHKKLKNYKRSKKYKYHHKKHRITVKKIKNKRSRKR